MMQKSINGLAVRVLIWCAVVVVSAQSDPVTADEAQVDDCSSDVVTTTSGLFCGRAFEARAEDGSSSTGLAFLGIPYGQSTGGKNRWEAPKPVNATSAVRPAYTFGPSCPQPVKPGVSIRWSEDCLRLNIWAPRISKNNAGDALPVMVFIYGGSFIDGTSTNPLFNGERLALAGNVVVVTLNYRLGALGFLSGVDGLTGNYGFLDQRLALEWIRDNIASFGGNSRKVVLFGESAGAMFVGLHLIAPESQPLFRAAIMQSNPYGLAFKTPGAARKFGEIFKAQVGCEFKGVACLRAIKSLEIVEKQASGLLPIVKLFSGFSSHLIWAPMVDGTVIRQQPVATAITKPTIIGTNRDEGVLFTSSNRVSILGRKKEIPRIEYEAALGLMFSLELAEKITKMPRYRPSSGDNTNVYARVITDYLFNCPNEHVLSLATSPAWGYRFRHVPSYSVWPSFPLCDPPNDTVCHGVEQPYVFGNPKTARIQPTESSDEFQPEEIELSRSMMRTWSTFAHQLTPDPDGTHWPRYQSQAPLFRTFGRSRVNDAAPPADCRFWNGIGYQLPGFLERLFNF